MKEAVPVRYEMRGFNTLLGSHYDHYYLEYDWYSFEAPSPNVFEVEQSIANFYFFSFLLRAKLD